MPPEVQLLLELRQTPRRRSVHIPSSSSLQSRANMLDSRGLTTTAPRSRLQRKGLMSRRTARRC